MNLDIKHNTFPLLMVFYIGAISFLGTAPALADTTTKETYASVENIPRILLSSIIGGLFFRDEYIAQLVDEMQSGDGVPREIDQAGIEDRIKVMETGKRREQYLSLITYDLDLNGSITLQEVTQTMQEDHRRQHQSLEGSADEAGRFVERYDTDKNGVISLPEMSAPEKLNEERKDRAIKRLIALLALDPNHDGKLTAKELEALARKAFATLDVDGNGLLAAEENQILRDMQDDFR